MKNKSRIKINKEIKIRNNMLMNKLYKCNKNKKRILKIVI